MTKLAKIQIVEELGINTPPGSPTDTNSWLMGDVPDGAWAGFPAHSVATYLTDWPDLWAVTQIDRDDMFIDRQYNILVRWDGTRFRTAGQMPLVPPKVDRLIYPTIMASQGATTTTAAGSNTVITYIPILFDRSLSITKLHVEAVGVTASGEIRLAIFTDNPSDSDPEDVLIESGAITATAAAMRTWTLSSALTVYPRRYWFAVRQNNSAITYTAVSTAGIQPIFGKADSTGTLATVQTARTENHAYGAFPTTATPAGFATTAIPIVASEIGPE